MNNFLNEKYAALAGALEKNIKHIIETKNLDFRIMEEEFVKQGYREDKPSGVENILIFRLDYMGDFILTTPAIREIRANYPYAFITLVVNKAVYPMAELCPYVNEVIPMDINYNALRKEGADVLAMLQYSANFAKEHFWKRNYSLAICLKNGPMIFDFFLTYFSGAKDRACNVNYSVSEIIKLFLNRPVVPPKEIVQLCAQNLYFLKALGLQVHSTNTELWYDAEDFYTAKKLLEGFAPNRIKIVVGIGANDLARKYSREKYLTAFKKIIHKGGGSLIIVGGPSEIEDAKFLEDNLPKDSVKNLAGKKLGWRVDSAIMSQSDMYIGNDTGTMHIAAAAKLPVVALFKESEDNLKLSAEKGVHTMYAQFFPWQTNVIDIKPKHSIGNCKNKIIYGGCGEDKPHCITQIEPREIVDAYETFAKLIKSSNIKTTTCPPILNSVNQVPKLYSNLKSP